MLRPFRYLMQQVSHSSFGRSSRAGGEAAGRRLRQRQMAASSTASNWLRIPSSSLVQEFTSQSRQLYPCTSASSLFQQQAQGHGVIAVQCMARDKRQLAFGAHIHHAQIAGLQRDSPFST